MVDFFLAYPRFIHKFDARPKTSIFKAFIGVGEKLSTFLLIFPIDFFPTTPTLLKSKSL